jgi:hypothetical protein
MIITESVLAQISVQTNYLPVLAQISVQTNYLQTLQNITKLCELVALPPP